MDLSKIMTISGKGGLYKVASQTRSGLLAESLTDGKRVHVFATERSSTLEDISIFTDEGELPLKKVLWRIYEKEEGKPVSISKSDEKALKKAFDEVIPEYDKERVYPSDIKKVFSWYNILLENDMISKPEEEEESSADDNAKPGADEDQDDQQQDKE